ncbi:MAG: YmdB family metallophosphoesterase, partial [Nitrospirae bacterium]
MRLLFLGDIVGKGGRRAVAQVVPRLRRERAIDLAIGNGENAAGGFGITREIKNGLLAAGLDLITSGNHVWAQKGFVGGMDEERAFLRPANYPPGTPGVGARTVRAANGVEVGVLNLMGRVFMQPLDDPFRVADREVARLAERVKVIVVDIHAEATSEKAALANYLDGRVSCCIGTHTHVLTADERILPGGTAFLTDAGLCGAVDSVIGMEKEVAIERFLTCRPARFKPVKRGPLWVCGAIVEIDEESG